MNAHISNHESWRIYRKSDQLLPVKIQPYTKSRNSVLDTKFNTVNTYVPVEIHYEHRRDVTSMVDICIEHKTQMGGTRGCEKVMQITHSAV